jgi:hypothetical protein
MVDLVTLLDLFPVKRRKSSRYCVAVLAFKTIVVSPIFRNLRLKSVISCAIFAREPPHYLAKGGDGCAGT